LLRIGFGTHEAPIAQPLGRLTDALRARGLHAGGSRNEPGIHERETTMSDSDLQVAVSDELKLDPSIDGRTVAVTVAGGPFALRGTVGSFHEKREARKAAERVPGVEANLDVTVSF
jgi:osmotically-inducible protein OsmY